jgi:hypothetical protein
MTHVSPAIGAGVKTHPLLTRGGTIEKWWALFEGNLYQVGKVLLMAHVLIGRRQQVEARALSQLKQFSI